MVIDHSSGFNLPDPGDLICARLPPKLRTGADPGDLGAIRGPLFTPQGNPCIRSGSARINCTGTGGARAPAQPTGMTGNDERIVRLTRSENASPIAPA